MINRYLVTGVVQGVGFRYFVATRANQLGLTGWVRNLPDGQVEVVVRGSPVQLADLELALERGPRSAQVRSVDKSSVSDEVDTPSPFAIIS